MKKVLNLLILGVFLLTITALNSCKKDKDMPTLTTTAVTDVTTTGASTGGNITDDGGAEVTARGVCWGTSANPSVTGTSKTSNGVGTGSFTATITDLTPNTLYYVRAYATNSEGTAYGNEVSFTTDEVVGASVTTAAVTTFTQTTATAGGNVTADGGAAISERGVYFGTTNNPSSGGTKVAAAAGGTGAFTCNLTNLTPGTLYYVMAYATNSSGVSYGSAVQFTTSATAPTVSTASVTTFTQSTATAGGNVSATGGASISERGVYFGTQNNPQTTGTKAAAATAGDGVFTVNLTGLTANTLYYVAAFATNTAGTSFGDVVSFTTSPVTLAVLTTSTPDFIATSSTSITAGGNISANGGGVITESGIVYGTSADVDYLTDQHVAAAGPATGAFEVTLEDLEEGTTYYLKAYARNGAGTAYGNEVQLLTRMSDREGNIYRTVMIGTQVWMAENLKVTQFNGGTPIPYITGNTNWAGQTAAAYCWYSDAPANEDLYGALYNWFAASSGNLCPTGWRVPSDADFNTLELYIGVPSANINDWGWRGTTEGSELKSTAGWADNGSGTNTSGFDARPAGYRQHTSGASYGANSLAYFWTTTEHAAVPAEGWFRHLSNVENRVNKAATLKTAGKSVRCVKQQ